MRNYLKFLNKAQSDYNTTNTRISSGCRFTQLSDDVSAGTRVLRTRMSMRKAEKQYDNVKAIGEQLNVQESAITSINDLLGTIHGTKVVKAEQESTGDTGRAAIAAELDGMLESIVQYANTKYDQTYVFGGTNATTPPFAVNSDGRLTYNGVNVDDIKQDADTGKYFYYTDPNDTTTKTEIPMNDDSYMDIGLGIRMNGTTVENGTGFKISFSGMELLGFGTDTDGNSNNLYNLIADIRDNIKDYDKTKLDELDTKLVKRTDEFRTNLTSIGTKTSFLDTMETKLQSDVNSYKTRISDLMGVNDAEEATNLTSNQYVLKAIIQMGAQLLPVSLMDYLS